MSNERPAYKDAIHSDNYRDYQLLCALIDELENLPGDHQVAFGKRVRAKHYLSNILENTQAKETIRPREDY